MVIADAHSVCLSACNSSRSCYASCDLSRLFFASYSYEYHLPKLKVSIPFKNVLPILRTSKVRVLTFSLIPDINVLIATLECERGLMKEYRIVFSEDQAIFRPAVSGDKSTPAVSFDTNDASSFSKVLSTIHVNSAADVVAISYDANDDGLKLFTDYHGAQVRQDIEVQKDALHTSLEMNNSIGHFGTIRDMLGMSTKVSFNLKDFSVLVQTAESLQGDLSLCFSVPGEPIVASCCPAVDARLEVVLVTLNDTGGGHMSSVYSGISGQQQLVGHGNAGNPLEIPGINSLTVDANDAAGCIPLGDDHDVIASTPPQSPDRMPAHMPGVIM